MEVKRHFEIEATLRRRPNTFTIPAAKFQQMDWPIEHLGPKAVVHPNQKEWARTAIQFLSSEIAEKRIFTHTGWRKYGEDKSICSKAEPSGRMASLKASTFN